MMMDLGSSLDRIRRRWRLAIALRAAGQALIAVALVNAAAALAAQWSNPPDGALMAMAAVTLVISLLIVAGAAWPLRRRPDDRQVARYIEEHCPDLDDTLVTAVDIRRNGGADRGFAPLVVQAAAKRLEGVELSRICDPNDLRRSAGLAAGGLVAFVLGAMLAAPLAETALQLAYVRLFPGSVTIQVRSGDLRVPAGKPVTLTASVAGRHGVLRRLAPTVTLESAQGQRATLPMTAGVAGYEVHITAVDRSFKYTVTAGPATSRSYAVTALFPARVQRIDLHYDYPSFSGLKPRDERDGGDVYAPAGTRVRLVVHTDKPIANGTLAFSEGKTSLPLARVGDRALQSTLTVKEEAAYRIGLIDADGLRSDGTEYFVRVMDDRPPDVHILRPSGDQGITSLEEVPIEARADDDFGIESFDMVYSVSGGPEKAVPFTSLGGTATARVGSRVLAVEDLRVKPGDVIAYYARARDVAHAKASTLARSEIFFLEVKPFNEEYSLAQSQAMAASTGTQLEGLISAQKEIISATWNLERRTTAGKSPADVKGVADAQAELKARAEQAAGQQRQRRRIGQPFLQVGLPAAGQQEPRPTGSGDPVRDAVDAMGRALQQLSTQKTADAIPHEMAALNALLQAQAEIRRRQITQSNGGGGANGNRQGQDLSNLFDRELKRQQRTNYESKAQVETTPDSQEQKGSALDRIRDLAKRQEELNRQQQELAKSRLPAEEMKRQLEKLTREQEELRRQAEEAAKQMAQQQASQGSKGSQGSQSAQGAEGARQDLGRAMEQMRDAAAQGQKDDAAGAAAKGEEAARQLRRAESQMQNGSPDARRRALGDLQLESQQIAEAQRRIANEAERLDQEGGGTADARRRLAGEKEQLADRVDAMQQAAQRLAEGKDGQDGKPANGAKDLGDAARQAARDLASQQIGQRMRTGAQGLRDAKNGRTAPAEQQIADALDKVARKMNGADAGGARGDTERLADQFDELRDARERLARLEKQIRDAGQAAQPQARDGRPASPQPGRDGTQARPSSDPQQKPGQASRQDSGQAAQPGAGQNPQQNSGQPGRAGQAGPEGREGQRGSQGDGQGGGDLARLQQEYNKELQRTRELMDRVQRGTPESGGRMTTPEEHEWSRSAPGTEAFKQDYAAWQSLAGDVARALERAEASVAGKLSSAIARDRLRAGGSERVPDAYKQRVSKYFESIATRKKAGDVR
jgi:hypothetical protein